MPLPRPLLLAIDTCGAVGGIALGLIPEASSAQVANFEHPRLWLRDLAGKTYSERLLSTVADLLQEAGSGPSQLCGVAVVHGPGSFTGIRIGVSAAKGLAEGLAIPLIAISRLELLARKAADGSVAVVLDAGRGEFFAGFYRDGKRQAEALLTKDALIEAVANNELSLAVCEERTFAVLGDLRPKLVAAPGASEALLLGMARFAIERFDDPSTLDGNYLRRSETEMLARIAEHAALRAVAQAGRS